jgi:hypothetical protein
MNDGNGYTAKFFISTLISAQGESEI